MTTTSRYTHKAFTLTEALVALVVLALVVTGGMRLVQQWSVSARTLPATAAYQASDAQVQQMIGELRSAIAVEYITANEVVALVSSNGSSNPTAPTVNGTKTGLYYVAYYS